MKPIISIIYPVYNSGKYIRKSMESLVNQTIFSRIEIVLVDDGSTDDSKSIYMEYADKYKNIKTIYQINKGVSSARNRALKNAVGDYIMFVDSDDYVDKYFCESMLKNVLENKADIGISNFSMIHPDGSQVVHWKNHKELIKDKYKILKYFFSGNYIGNNLFEKIFRKSIIDNIEFMNGYAIGEDMYFVYQALKKSAVVSIDTSHSLYFYELHAGSAMFSTFNRHYLDTIYLSEKMVEDWKNDKEMFELAQAHVIHEKYKVLEYMYRSNAAKTYEKIKVQLLRDIRNYDVVSAKRYFTTRRFLAFLLMRISPPFYMFVSQLMKVG